MNKEKWICWKCGYRDNTGPFCNQCGASPRSLMEENSLTFKEARKQKEKHGPLIAVCFSGRSSGMMRYSDSIHKRELFYEEEELILRTQEKNGLEPEIIRKYRVDPEVLRKIQEIAETENMAAWSRVKDDPKEFLMVTDMSSSSSLALTFDDSELGVVPRHTAYLNLHAIYHQGGGETIDKIREILDACEKEDHLLEKIENKDPRKVLYETKAEELADGMWTCPCCGYRKNQGKFCSECGTKKPE